MESINPISKQFLRPRLTKKQIEAACGNKPLAFKQKYSESNIVKQLFLTPL